MKRFRPLLFAVILAVLLAVSVFLNEKTADGLPPEDATETQAEAQNNDTTAAQTAEQSTTAAETPTTGQITEITPVTVSATTGVHEDSSADVTLNVELPSANGEIYVDSQPDNKFIVIVNDARAVDASKLVAVYSLPDTGQNYVLEFETTDGERNADTLVRVFLIDESGKISSVCSSNSKLCENVSSVENWFCMNVILKRMILPAIKDRL